MLTNTERQLQEAIRDNMVKFMLEIGDHNTDVEFEHNDQITRYLINIPHPMLNRVLRSEASSKEELTDQVRHTIERYRQHALPIMWYNWNLNEPTELVSHLVENGFQKIGVMPGMAINLDELEAEKVTISGFEMKPVTNLAEFEWFGNITKLGFNIPQPVADKFLKIMEPVGFGEDAAIRHYLGWLDGNPVSTISSYCHDGIVGLYNVATLEQARGKGIGRATTLHPMFVEKENGCKTAILHATALGYNVYKKIGFQDCVEVEMYLLA